MIKKIQLPKSISPCPIIETSVELRCDFSVPTDTIIGILFNQFSNEFQVVNLPNSNIPKEIRSVDPNFKYQATHRLINLKNNNLLIDVGNNIIKLIYILNYQGWNFFKTFIDTTLYKIFELNIAYNIHYLSLRYIDFFPQQNIFKNINAHIILNNNPIGKDFTVLNTEIKENGFVKVLQIANNAHVKNIVTDADGSIIDLTIVRNKSIDQGLSKIIEYIETSHNMQKETFYSLLLPSFLKTLNPQY